MTRLRLPLVVLSTGVLAGLGGIAVTYLLHAVQHLAYGYDVGSFESGAEHASAARRVIAVTLAGLVGGLGWWALRRRAAPVTVETALTGTRMPLLATAVNAVLQIAVVAGGASLGRETAPRELGAAAGGWLAEHASLSAGQRRTVLACGAGAGLAAVYDVPVSGLLFTVEALLATVAPAAVLAAGLACGSATAVADLVLGRHPFYPTSTPPLHALLLACALALGPVAGLAGRGFRALASRARLAAPTGWRLVPAGVGLFGALGGASVAYPELLGNGRGPAQLVLAGSIGLPTVALLLVLRPLATAACLRAGATGGLLTPALAVGALLGGLAGGALHHLDPGTPVAGLALVGAAAVLSVTLRAPLTAVALIVELTGGGVTLVVPLVLGVLGAQAIDRSLGATGTLGWWQQRRWQRAR